ncbi:MAG: DUF6775 family putative metallopeptidase, partial [Candidatus Helarchaeota archaeon]
NESNVRLNELQTFIKETFGISEVLLRNKFIDTHRAKLNIEDIAAHLAAIRVKDVLKPHTRNKPFYGEIQFEERYLEGKISQIKGILYDAVQLLLFYWDLIPDLERGPNTLHIVITDRLIGTYSEVDKRYHIRSIVCSGLSLISTSGIVEGPAKSRIYYRLKYQQATIGLNLPLDIIKTLFDGEFIDYNDPKLTEILKGFISQAIFFHLTGEPFCTNKDCRLYNAHWQSELIHAQLIQGQFCAKHQKKITQFKQAFSQQQN